MPGEGSSSLNPYAPAAAVSSVSGHRYLNLLFVAGLGRLGLDELLGFVRYEGGRLGLDRGRDHVARYRERLTDEQTHHLVARQLERQQRTPVKEVRPEPWALGQPL